MSRQQHDSLPSMWAVGQFGDHLFTTKHLTNAYGRSEDTRYEVHTRTEPPRTKGSSRHALQRIAMKSTHHPLLAFE